MCRVCHVGLTWFLGSFKKKKIPVDSKRGDTHLYSQHGERDLWDSKASLVYMMSSS